MLNRLRATPGRRPGPPAYLVCALALLVLGRLPPSPAWGAEDGVTVEPREKWSGVFGGKEVDVHLVVKVPRALKGRVGWTFSTTNRRTIASGDVGVTASPDRPGTATVRLRVPEVREGVVLRAQLAVSVFGDGDRKPLAAHEQPLWIFPGNPFAGRTDCLKE